MYNKKWTPSLMCHPQDNIISSKAAAKGLKGFTPTYEKANHNVMRYLISNQYMKMWFCERDNFSKFMYRDETAIKKVFGPYREPKLLGRKKIEADKLKAKQLEGEKVKTQK